MCVERVSAKIENVDVVETVKAEQGEVLTCE